MLVIAGRGESALDHFGFQCDTRAEVDRVAELARTHDIGLSRQLVLVAWSDTSPVRDPNGHVVRFTYE